MKTSAATKFRNVLAALREFGLLLETDSALPSVSGLVAGEPIRGSWWKHSQSHEIFAVLQEVVDHKDVLVTKLVCGKVTFVQRRLWADVLSIGLAREAWQMTKLPLSGQMLLDQIDQKGSLQTNQLDWPTKFQAEKPGEVVRELEKRILIHSQEFHTETGAHAKLIESWEYWARRTRFKGERVAVGNAKRKLEQRIEALNERFGASAKLPWSV
ncbi:MAG: hypothetical protein JWM21_1845 [Acidobacteria bacterium]|nr:hypothetical protein [Acidobacteriota bacterium]